MNSVKPTSVFSWSMLGSILALCFSMNAFSQGSHPLDNLEPGEWFEVPNSRLDSANPCPSVVCPPGNTGLQGVVIAWSGGTYDTVNDQLLIWGGGHADYSGNEIYGFDVQSLSWSRVAEPSSSFGGDASSFLYPDGKPRSLHTHNYIEFVPPLNSFVSFGGVAPYPEGGRTTQRVFQYKLATGEWDVNSIPDIPPGGRSRGANAVYDPAINKVWLAQANMANSRLHLYDPDTNSWTSHSEYFVEFGSVAALDPDRRLLVTVGSGQLLVWDLDNPDADPFTPNTTGDKYLEGRGAPGFVFDPTIQKFVGWSSGTSVYTLDPDTWRWTRVAAADSNSVTPTNADQRGTYGRFQYMPQWNAYLVVNNTNQNVYMYKLNDEAVVQSDPPANLR
ncbi:MAG: hypothetical protein AB8F65_10590 [Woeseiaceae bacterium]